MTRPASNTPIVLPPWGHLVPPKSHALLWEVFRLIWIEDAPYVEGGSEKLDDLAVRIGQYLRVPEEQLNG